MLYALKKVQIQKLNEKEKENALDEIRILASVKHSNVISYKEAFFDKNDQCLCLIMEYANSGDLSQKIKSNLKKGTKINEKTIWSIFIQITHGLKALHDLGVFHRDIKSANVFLKKDGSAKLGDMNVSKVSKDGFLKTQTGTPYYASPEVWKDKKYTNKSDIWSLGCVLYEAITLKTPFDGHNMHELFENVIAGHINPIPKIYSRDLGLLLKVLININPSERPSCDEILNSDIIKRHSIGYATTSRSNTLLEPIKIPKEIHLLSFSLPKSSYNDLDSDIIDQLPRDCDNQGGNSLLEGNSSRLDEKSVVNETAKLPILKNNAYSQNKKKIVLKLAESSSQRINRIKEAYLSPRRVFLSPQNAKTERKSARRKSPII
ncbi:hypothetical protein SteCoe_35383 [Stentor coeruleus]|uniref:non-specific serine/threonine protein kinase n=1 Tax=Stentor coeruleus TaxID=5963 RepID=A0A1R2ASG4_9CILI|nr:hypothetical protein SteCoe_35383 [Stentor coeruleus]